MAVSWTKKQRDRVKTEPGKALYIMGYRGNQGGIEHSGLLEDGLAYKLTMFGVYLYKGFTPQEAWRKAGFDEPETAAEAVSQAEFQNGVKAV